LIQLARWRRRTVLATLADWAQGTQSLLNGTVARVLLLGQSTFSVDDAVPIYRMLLRRRDDAGEVLATHLGDPDQDKTWLLDTLTEIARLADEDVRQVMDHVFQTTALENPQVVVQALRDWAHHEERGIRETALSLMSSVGKAQTREKDPSSGPNVLGCVYGEQWFGTLTDLAADSLPTIRARLAYLAPDFAHMDAVRTVKILALLSQDEQERIRQLAALALAPLAARYADEIIPVMEDLVGDDSPRVREATIPAIADGIAQVEVVPAVSLLATLVRDPALSDAATTAFVSVAAARIETAATPLGALSKDTNAALRNAVLEVALKTGDTHPVVTSTFLAPLARDHSAVLRERVVKACQPIAQRDPTAPLDLLAQLVLDRHPRIREQALDTLTNAGLKAPQEGLRTLRHLAQEHRSEVKLLVLQALQSFTSDHAPAVLEVVDLLIRDHDLRVRRATVPLIAGAGKREPVGAMERLGRLLLDLDPRVREPAQEALLGLCTTKDKRLLPILSQLATHSSSTAHNPALEGLTEFVSVAPDAVLQAVTPVIEGDMEETQEAALPVLYEVAQVRLTSAVETLAPLLQEEGRYRKARDLYWEILRLPADSPIVTQPDAVIRSLAQNANWDSKGARKALQLGEYVAFVRQRVTARISGEIK
jgi:hypothetical protein